MTAHRRTLAVLLLVPAVALGACGGGSDKDKVTDIVNGIGDSGGTSLCDHATDKVLKKLGGSADACRKQLDKGPATPNDMEKVDVKVDGDTAVANITVKGGGTSVFTLVKDGGDWKVDDVK